MQKASKIKRVKGILQHERCQMVYDILMLMEKRKDLPLPNIYRLCKVIKEYYIKEGFRNELRERGSKWNLTIRYIKENIKVIKQVSRENLHPFDFYRQRDMLRGAWQFLNKKMFIDNAERALLELNTRKDTYNAIIDDGNNKLGYKLQLPKIQEFTKIGSRKEQLQITKE